MNYPQKGNTVIVHYVGTREGVVIICVSPHLCVPVSWTLLPTTG